MSKKHKDKWRIHSMPKSSAANQFQRSYKNWLMQLEAYSMSRFEWSGLPSSVNERFLERTLMMDGKAVYFSLDGVEMATRVINHGPGNVYDEYNQYTATGNNGFNYRIPDGEGVMIYNSMTRKDFYGMLMDTAYELAELDQIMRVNRKQQRASAIFAGPDESKAEMDQLLRDLEEGTWVRIATPQFLDNNKIEILKANVPYLQSDFHEDKQHTLNQALSILGIEMIPFEKTERLVSAEAEIAADQTARIREDVLLPRMKACEEINEKFGTNISVKWRTQQYDDITKPHNLSVNEIEEEEEVVSND